MPRWLATLLLLLSAAGLPLAVILPRRFGRRGGLAMTAACGVLLARDAGMAVSGVPAQLRLLPRLLLFAEIAASGTAAGTGLRACGLPASGQRASGQPPSGQRAHGPARAATMAAVATFALHTARFAIYLSPGQGRKPPAAQ